MIEIELLDLERLESVTTLDEFFCVEPLRLKSHDYPLLLII